MSRLLVVFVVSTCAWTQALPGFRWIQELNGSGSDTVIGMGTDAVGNTYIAGNTTSPDFPVKSAAQDHSASAGLFRIDGPGSAWSALNLPSATSIAPDPLNPGILYAASSGAALKTTDDGKTWSRMAISSAAIQTIAIDPSNSNTLYAGTNALGAFKSTDAGSSWQAINSGLQASLSFPGQIYVNQFWMALSIAQ